MLEPLEPRRHLSAAIYVTINKAAITVRGTDGADRLRIEGTADFAGNPDYGYAIYPEGDTPLIVNGKPFNSQINGGNNLYVDYGTRNWYKPLRIDLGAGDDVLTTGGLPGTSSVTYKLGEGNDRMQVTQASGFLGVDGGLGEDDISISTDLDFNVGNVAVYPGTGRDRVYMSCFIEHDNDGIQGKLLIDDAGGPTDVTLAGVRVMRDAYLQTRNARDRITITASRFYRPLTIHTGGGTDTITADAASTFKRGAAVNAGDEDDSVVGF